MRPRMDCAHGLVAAAWELLAVCVGVRSIARRSRNGPTPEMICPCSSAQNAGFHYLTPEEQAELCLRYELPHEVIEELAEAERDNIEATR
jgi:hypothetical protein